MYCRLNKKHIGSLGLNILILKAIVYCLSYFDLSLSLSLSCSKNLQFYMNLVFLSLYNIYNVEVNLVKLADPVITFQRTRSPQIN